MSTVSDPSPAILGWTGSPNGRGSLDILWSCAFTTFLCAWSALCSNIPAPGSKFWRRGIARKLFLGAMCLLIPDLVSYLALGQYGSARESVKAFRRSGYDEWSMKHAFFANMGGFWLTTGDNISWPLDAHQLHYLIVEGWLDHQTVVNQVMLSKDVIEDKNKVNSFLRLITIAQTLWFVSNCIGRQIQGLTITTIELTTLGLIPTTIALMVWWWEKPADVDRPEYLKISATVEDIHARAGFTKRWYDTPLDFLNPEASWCYVAWVYDLNILRKLRLFPAWTGLIDNRRDDDFPNVSRGNNYIIALVGSIPFVLNILAWNFWFATKTERVLWQVASIVSATSVVTGWLYQELLWYLFRDLRRNACDNFAAWKNEGMQDISTEKATVKGKLLRKIRTMGYLLRNNSLDGNPAMTMPLVVLLPFQFFSAAYALARTYILVEDLIAFRALPANVYQTVNWSQMLPHFA